MSRRKHEARLDGVKTCIRCRVEKPRLEFGPTPNTMDGRIGACRDCERLRTSRARHGLTAEDKKEIAKRQGGCLICRRTYPGARGWGVDHDRSCCPGERSCERCRRGVLCGWCNRALGYAGDSPEILRRMADYIEQHHANAMPDALPGHETPALLAEMPDAIHERTDETYEELSYGRNQASGPYQARTYDDLTRFPAASQRNLAGRSVA